MPLGLGEQLLLSITSKFQLVPIKYMLTQDTQTYKYAHEHHLILWTSERIVGKNKEHIFVLDLTQCLHSNQLVNLG